jgi:hypothetical protein
MEESLSNLSGKRHRENENIDNSDENNEKLEEEKEGIEDEETDYENYENEENEDENVDIENENVEDDVILHNVINKLKKKNYNKHSFLLYMKRIYLFIYLYKRPYCQSSMG